MAIAGADGLSKLQAISLAMSHFGDALNQGRGVQSNYAGQNLQQLQALQRQLLFQQELQKKKAQEGATAAVVGGYDPSSGITWNTGRQASSGNTQILESAPMPADQAYDPKAIAGIANRTDRMKAAGIATDAEGGALFTPGIMAREDLDRGQKDFAADQTATLKAAFPEETAKATLSKLLTPEEAKNYAVTNADGSVEIRLMSPTSARALAATGVKVAEAGAVDAVPEKAAKIQEIEALYGKDWQKNPAAVDIYKKSILPMQVSLSANTQGETEFAKTEGKELGMQAAEVFSAADKARNRAGLLDTFEALQENFKTGKLAPIYQTVGGWAQALGIDPATLGIPANAAMSGEAMDMISNRLTVENIGPGGLPANNFSEADRKFAQATTVQKINSPEANLIIRQIARANDQRMMLKEQMWIDARKRGVNFPDFKKQWSEYVQQTPAFPRINSPEELAALQPGSLFTAPDGTIRVKAIGAPQ